MCCLGWGLGSRSFALHQVHLELLNQSVCDTIFGRSFVQDLMICAGDVEAGGRDTCSVTIFTEFVVNYESSLVHYM